MRDTYASIRRNGRTDDEIIRAFCAGEPVKEFMWSSLPLPCGSRVLTFAEEPRALYSGDKDTIFFSAKASRSLTTLNTLWGSSVVFDTADELFWEEYHRLKFLTRFCTPKEG